MANIIDGDAIAKEVVLRVASQAKQLVSKKKRAPGLAVIVVGENPASKIYVSNKRKICTEIGIVSKDYDLSNSTTEDELLALIERLNNDTSVDGILVQLPLPKHINNDKIIEKISPNKDVDGFHPYNLGLLMAGKPVLRPCTPKGIMTLLNSIDIELKGKLAVVIGASRIVGKPMALELINAHATVTVCRSSTQDLPGLIRQADIVIAATGVPQLVKGDWIKKGAVVIDVGINRLSDGKLVGDVDFEHAKNRASWITPVPGGVGPMTVATLMENTLLAALNNG